MIKKYITTAIMCMVALFISAQKQYSLEECKHLTIQNNRKIKNSQLEIESSKEIKKDAFTKYFPTVSASGFGFTAKDPLIALTMGGAPINFLKNGVNVGIIATQPIFTGGKIVNGNKLANIGTQVSQYRAKISENDMLLNTENMYWELVSLYEKRKTLDKIDNQVEQLLKDVTLSYSMGVITNNDVLKVKLKRNELSSNRFNLENSLRLVKMALCKQMAMNLNFADSLEIQIPDIDNIESPIRYYVDHKNVLPNRAESKLLNKNVEATILQTKIKRGDYLPTVAIGATYYRDNFLDSWKSNGAVFVSVSIPISDWWGGSHAIKQQKVQEQIALNNKIDIEEQLLLQMQSVKNELDNAYKQILLAKDGVEQATENLRLNNNYYKVGTVTLTDLLDAQSLLQQNRDKYVESYTEYQKKCIEYLQVTGQ